MEHNKKLKTEQDLQQSKRLLSINSNKTTKINNRITETWQETVITTKYISRKNMTPSNTFVISFFSFLLFWLFCDFVFISYSIQNSNLVVLVFFFYYTVLYCTDSKF